MNEDEARETLAHGLIGLRPGRRVLVLLPDGTRHAPIPLMFRLLQELIGKRAVRLDFMIALGTHPAMPDDAIAHLLGIPAAEREARYPNTSIHNHEWGRPQALERFGTLTSAEVEKLTDGILAEAMPVDLNRMILDYDELIICGPVFPHEVAGFSGGAKYIIQRHALAGCTCLEHANDRRQGHGGSAGHPPRRRARAHSDHVHRAGGSR